MRINHLNRVVIFIGISILWFLLPVVATPHENGDTFVVTNTDDSGPGSLRQAILDANANPGKDEIEFDIPGSGSHTIRPETRLPDITDAVVVDGYSQQGAEPNSSSMSKAINARIKIELDGSLVARAPGLDIAADDCEIRGLAIYGFEDDAGILLESGHNKVQGNFLGTKADGTTAMGNFNGVYIEEAVGNIENVIGGTEARDRNLISGNLLDGVFINTDHNKVQGNFIGTDITGTVGLANDNGVTLTSQCKNNVIGGTDPDARNLISGNENIGIALETNVENNEIEGNYLGTDLSGKKDLNNDFAGVQIDGNNNVVGGAHKDAGNVIAFNSTGVLITGGAGNAIRSNSIFNNERLGIDLGELIGGDPDGVTENDAGDSDSGPNNLQNFPVLDSAAVVGSSLTVSGTIDTPAPETVTIEFFASKAADPSGHGEGEEFLGTTQPNGLGEFQTNLTVPEAGFFISATATDKDGNTSEFSATITAHSEPDIGANRTQLTFSNTPVDSVRERSVTIKNVGSADLVITRVSLAGEHEDEFELFSFDVPATLEPDEQKEITVRFTRMSVGNKRARLKIESNDPDENPLIIKVRGPDSSVVAKQFVFDDAADTFIDGRKLDRNHGGSQFLRIGNSGTPHRRPYRTLIEFDFLAALQDSGVMSSSQIVSATLEMHLFRPSGDDPDGLSIDAFRMNRDWTEGMSATAPAAMGEATYRSAKHNVEDWAARGAAGVPADREGDPDDTQFVSLPGRIRWDVSDSVQDLFDSQQNFGWLLQSQDESRDKYFRFYAADHMTERRRPKLIVMAEVLPMSASSLAKRQPGPNDVQLEAEAVAPDDFSLMQNYPNPFNPETQIRYEIASPATVTLMVFDLTGAEVRRLLDRAVTPTGTFSVIWDGRDASGRASSSGVYFYRLFVQPQDGEIKPFVQTRRMILLK